MISNMKQNILFHYIDTNFFVFTISSYMFRPLAEKELLYIMFINKASYEIKCHFPSPNSSNNSMSATSDFRLSPRCKGGLFRFSDLLKEL